MESKREVRGRLLSRCDATAVATLVTVAVACTSSARAQEISDGGYLVCPGLAVDVLDQPTPITRGGVGSEVIQEYLSFGCEVEAAARYCRDPAHVGLPGCARLVSIHGNAGRIAADVESALAASDPDEVWTATDRLLDDLNHVRVELRRATAHETCRAAALANALDETSAQRCAELVGLERGPTSAATTAASMAAAARPGALSAQDTRLLERVAAESQTVMGMSRSAVTSVEALDLVRERALTSTVFSSADARALASLMQRLDVDAYYANAPMPALAKGGDLVGLAEAINGGPPQPLRDCSDGHGPAITNHDMLTLVTRARRMTTDCRGADLYISSEGEMFRAGHPWPSELALPAWPLPTSFTICVDVLDARPKEPLIVELRTATHVAELRLLPGIVMTVPPGGSLDSFDDADVLTVTVRAVLRGAALRRLAVVNGLFDAGLASSGAPGPVSWRGVIREAERIAAQRREAQIPEQEIALRRELIAVVNGDAQVTASLSRVRVAIRSHQSLVGRTDGAVDTERRTALHELEQAWSDFRERALAVTASWGLRDTTRTRISQVAIGSFYAAVPTMIQPEVAALAPYQSWASEIVKTTQSAPTDAERTARREQEQAQERHQARLELLCELAAMPVRIVTHQLLLEHDAAVALYDFETGHESLGGDGLLDDQDDLYLVVQRVPGNRTLLVELDGRDLRSGETFLLGVPPDAADDEPAYEDALRAHVLRPDDSSLEALRRQVSLRGTQVIPVGSLEGSRDYRITVCEKAGLTAIGACGDAGSRTIADHSIRVRGRHRVGIRAGLGVSVRDTGALALQRVSSDSDQWLLVPSNSPAAFSVPVLLSLYLLHGGRDLYSFELGDPTGFNIAFTTGVDAIAPDSRWPIFGVLADIWGVAVGASLLLERVPRPVGARAGDTVVRDSDSLVSVSDVWPTQDQFVVGGLFSLTFDLDVFQRLVMAVVEDERLPRLGTAHGGGN